MATAINGPFVRVTFVSLYLEVWLPACRRLDTWAW